MAVLSWWSDLSGELLEQASLSLAELPCPGAPRSAQERPGAPRAQQNRWFFPLLLWCLFLENCLRVLGYGGVYICSVPHLSAHYVYQVLFVDCV